ncbi:ABC transporter ATP-binding protein [Amorphus orientalis]|uniref:NitT/TauT family transport system ATP-binding protein n=1 Tax=Amorphus orientalis TaxID=649198 RepID=A0AAE3VK84_9HYPH|nr:ABC transporter ATP-binding protein [Amorphus orientalis]MDQ0313899.1 NitT/TauT family transport system ATP-binding protein [Amorphus orientalis]
MIRTAAASADRASESAVALRGVTKTFPGGVTAVRHVDLDVRQGEFLSLLGPSGCGKSTVLRMVAGLASPSSGQILHPHDAKARDVGFVFQEPTLMPWASAFSNVWLPLRLKGVSKRAAEARVMSALEGVGLADFAHSYPRELSGGMRMRVSLARALVTEPSLLLLDEPFAALDEITRFKLNNDLLELWQRHGFTVVFVTHSVFESVYLSSRIAVMAARPGRILRTLSIDEPYPRQDAFRTSEAYAGFCRETSDALAQAMAADAVA